MGRVTVDFQNMTDEERVAAANIAIDKANDAFVRISSKGPLVTMANIDVCF